MSVLAPAGMLVDPRIVKVEVAEEVSTSTVTSVVPNGRLRLSPEVTSLPFTLKLANPVLVSAAATSILKV